MKNENEKKPFFENIQQGMTQKTTKRLTEIQALSKKFIK